MSPWNAAIGVFLAWTVILFIAILGRLIWIVRFNVVGYTKEARTLCLTAFGQRLPPKWVVYVRDSGGISTVQRPEMVKGLPGLSTTLGYCDRRAKHIVIYRDVHHFLHSPDELETLVHEFVHVLWPGLEHGAEFDAKVEEGMFNLWRLAADGVGRRSTTAIDSILQRMADFFGGKAIVCAKCGRHGIVSDATKTMCPDCRGEA